MHPPDPVHAPGGVSKVRERAGSPASWSDPRLSMRPLSSRESPVLARRFSAKGISIAPEGTGL